MLILLKCEDQFATLLDVVDFAELRHEAIAMFAPILTPGYEVDLYYPFPFGGEMVDVSVRCQQGLKTFIKLSGETATANAKGKPPILWVRECLPLNIPSAENSPHRNGNGEPTKEPVQLEDPPQEDPAPVQAGRKAAPPARNSGPPSAEEERVPAFRKAMKSAAPPAATTDAQESTTEAPPPRTDAMDYTNHNTAQRLLSSFKFTYEPPPPQIRALLRDGSCSALVDFDPYNPPAVGKLRDQIRASLGPMIGVDPKSKEYSWIIAAYTGNTKFESDVDDDKDVMYVSKLVKQYGDLEVQLLVDVLDPEQAMTSPRPSAAILDLPGQGHTVHPASPNLEVNLVHTPQKIKRRQKEAADAAKKEALLSPQRSRQDEDEEEDEEDGGEGEGDADEAEDE